MKRVSYVLFLLGLAAAAPATAQNLPGYDNDFDQARAQYRAYAIGEFQQVLTGWLKAIEEHDAHRAAEFYSEDGFVYLGEEAIGRADVEGALERWLGRLDGIQTGMRDFDASGSMSYATLNLMVNAADPDADGPGTMMLVLTKERGGWKIRSQTVVMHPEPGSGSGS
jgi:ketosteroid isomerase-like protein